MAREKGREFCYSGVFCRSGRSSGTIAPSTGQTCRQIPQSMQVEKSIQYQSIPFRFLLELGWIQATGQASTQSATPSQVSVTIEWGIGNLQKGQGVRARRKTQNLKLLHTSSFNYSSLTGSTLAVPSEEIQAIAAIWRCWA